MGNYATVVAQDSPALYWRLGDASGATTATSGLTSGATATYVGSPTLGVTGLLTGDADTAASLDGVDDAISYTWGAGQSLQNYAFEVWVNLPATVVDGFLAATWLSAGGKAWSLEIVNNVPIFLVMNSSGVSDSISAPSALANNTTYHIVASYNGFLSTGDLALYLNGTLVASKTRSANSSVSVANAPLTIGMRDGSSAYVKGVVDEAAFYVFAAGSPNLSLSRVQAHYAAGTTLVATSSAPTPYNGITPTYAAITADVIRVSAAYAVVTTSSFGVPAASVVRAASASNVTDQLVFSGKPPLTGQLWPR